MRLSKLLLCGLLACPGYVLAQSPVSLVVAGQVHGMKARFSDGQPVSDRISLVPWLYRDLMLGIAVGLAPRYMLQATIGLTSYGLAFERQPSGNVGTFTQNALEFAVVLRRQYQTATKPGRVWFTDMGIDVEYIGDTFGISAFGFGGSLSGTTTGPGSETIGSAISGNPYRLGLRLGAGREWALSPRHYVALEALASFGIQDLQRYKMQSVVWEKGRNIDPVYYQNTVATRFSFVGIQARYRFQFGEAPL